MMTAKAKINVLQAYDRGEEIEERSFLTGQWETTSKPIWNFDNYEYRIKKQMEFKAGDKVVPRDLEGDFVPKKDIFEIRKINHGSQYFNTSLYPISFTEARNWININNCLWYWEYYDQVDKQYKSSLNERQTKEEAIRSLNIRNYTDLQPLYALGFKLPKEIK